jgi:uncharacterized protein
MTMKSVRKTPMRTCIISKVSYPKNELIRVVKTPEGEIKVDHTGKLNGRGAYIKLSNETIIKAQKGNVFGKHLECDIPATIYEELKNMLS